MVSCSLKKKQVLIKIGLIIQWLNKSEFLKQFSNKILVIKNVTENANRMLNKSLRKEVETLGLYWCTQPKLCLVLLYLIIKGSTNQNLITKQLF